MSNQMCCYIPEIDTDKDGYSRKMAVGVVGREGVGDLVSVGLVRAC